MGAPTETVYGLAANALDVKACAEIFRVKGRPSTDPLIVHVLSLAEAETLAVFNDEARALARAFWPGPLTLVLPKRSLVPGIVTAGLDSVAIRVPRHPVFRALLRASKLFLAAPSANPFGYISPTTAEHVRDSLGDRIDFILDGGSCRVGVESTIVDARKPGAFRILRPGMITGEKIAQATQLSLRSVRRSARSRTQPQASDAVAQVAPGMLTRHYSPSTSLRLVKRITPTHWRSHPASERVAWVFFARPRPLPAEVFEANVYWWSETGRVEQAARRLFGLLRMLDACGYEEIVAEIIPASPGAEALNDRLRRAAAKTV